MRTALQEQGLPAESCDVLFSTLALKDLDTLANVLGDDSAAVRDPPLTHARPTPNPRQAHP